MNFDIIFYLHVKEANYWFNWLNTQYNELFLFEDIHLLNEWGEEGTLSAVRRAPYVCMASARPGGGLKPMSPL